MKIDIRIIAEASLEEAETIIPIIQKLDGEINLAIENIEKHLDIVVAKRGYDRHGFFDLPSKDDPKEIGKEGCSLAEWYKDKMYLSVRARNILARENIFPRELVEMKDHQLLAIKDLGESSLEEIKRGLELYFTISI